MADSNHTPGPWFVGRRGYNTAGIEVGPRYPNGPGIWSIAYVEDADNDDLPADEQDANARLIAAAPEMLAIVEAVAGADSFDTIGSIKIDVPGQDRAWLKRAAVALLDRIAKGESTATSLSESSDVPSTGRED